MRHRHEALWFFFPSGNWECFLCLEPHLGHGAEQRVAGGTVADSSIQLPLWQYFLISSSPHDDNDNDNNDESLFCLL